MIKDKKQKSYRIWEIIPGLISWTIILLPLWGSFFMPKVVAYFVISFLVFWFYQSFKSAFLGIRGYSKIQADIKTNWKKRYEKEKKANWIPWEDIRHVIIIPNYQEEIETLKNPLDSLVRQKSIDKKQIYVALAMEKRAGPDAEKRAKTLIKMYQSEFGMITATYHPDGIVGEIKGKASNEAYAAKHFKKNVIDKLGLDIKLLTVTSCDADIKFNSKYFSALTYNFSKNKNRYVRFWQSPIFWYNNLDKVPSPVRIVGIIGNIIHVSNLQEPDGIFFNYSTYSLSYKMLDDVGYWDTDIIPEDWHIFLQSFFGKRGKVKVNPIFLPTSIDAPEGKTYAEALKNRYLQAQRHAWGATDLAFAVRLAEEHPEIPWRVKLPRVFKILETHLIWSTNWFILTLGALLPTLVNPKFMQTSLGYNLPKFSQLVLTVCLLALAVTIILDLRLRPEELKNKSLKGKVLELAQWILMPVATLFMAVLPGLDAQTRLMLGKRIEYKVTKKI